MNNYNDKISAVYDPNRNTKSDYNQNYNDVDSVLTVSEAISPLTRLECLARYQCNLQQLMDTLAAKLQPVMYSDVPMKAEVTIETNKIGPEFAVERDSILAQSIVNSIYNEKLLIENIKHLINNIQL